MPALITTTSDCNNDKLRSVIPILRKMIDEEGVGTDISGCVGTLTRWWDGKVEVDCVIDTSPAHAGLLFLLLYIPVASRPGGEPSEYHVKTQLWCPILTTTFSMQGDPFIRPVCEYHHQFS